MSRKIQLLLGVSTILCVSVVRPAQQAGQRAAAIEKIDQAWKMSAHDESEKAVDSLREAIAESGADLSPGLRADILLNQAALLEQQGKFTEAAAVYCAAIAVEGLDARTLNLGYNNLANLLLHTKAPPACEPIAGAQEAFAKIRLDVERPAQQAIYLFNHGHAHEANGNRRGAIELYEKAIDADPSLEIAARAKLDLLVTDPGKSALHSARTIRMLANRNQFDLASKLAAGEVARASWTVAESEELLAAFVYAEARRGASFGSHPQRLDALLRQMQRGRPEITEAIDDIRRAYFAGDGFELLAFARKEEVERFFPYWTAARRKSDFSALLVSLASYHRLNGDLERALSYYSAAWQVDPANARAAVHAWTIITTDRERYDPTGRLWDRLSFYLRGEYYRVAGKRQISDDELADLGLTLLIYAEARDRAGETAKVNDALKEAEQLFNRAGATPGGARAKVEALCGSESRHRSCRGLVSEIDRIESGTQQKR